ncbi:hypothetical protein [Pseudomonas sp.]|uniref:hypothetical protein n=1 Tax=Pseudomonas sp. TaxID=306 RepID=UPI0027364097|nr:hypothetical protein [Pseudomonas sp.]MDP2747359.1 hypothetical protein [Pseudomonas sp.]
MNIDIKHKHAGHVIVIEGHPFKANAAGQWNLTEVWRALKLDPKKSPGQWRTKEAKRLEAMQNLHSSNGAASWATKRATIEYAAWVSPEFKDMVFDAFEAVLENPEVAHAVAKVMHESGHRHSATILERILTENQERNSILRGLSKGRTLSPAQQEHRRVSRRINAEATKAHKQGREWC